MKIFFLAIVLVLSVSGFRVSAQVKQPIRPDTILSLDSQRLDHWKLKRDTLYYEQPIPIDSLLKELLAGHSGYKLNGLIPQENLLPNQRSETQDRMPCLNPGGGFNMPVFVPDPSQNFTLLIK